MATPQIRSHVEGPWTVDDLYALPDDGFRYEIFDGSLLVSPPPEFSHASTATILRDALNRQGSDNFALLDSPGLYVTPTKYYIPDLVVIARERLRDRGRCLGPADVRLAVEVVSPNNPSNDLVLKRHAYAAAGIPRYWIVDERDKTITVLGLDGSGGYSQLAVARRGQALRADEPYPLTVDLEEIF